jgi:fructosamine-3-kinase
MLHPDTQQQLEEILHVQILTDTVVSGGCINDARLLTTSTGNFFLKQNTNAALLETEVVGLQALAATQTMRVPEVLLLETVEQTTLLVLEFIEQGTRATSFWERFGTSLAELHSITAPKFGFSSNNFIGSLPQSNRQHTNWTSFYWNERIQPQLQTALQGGRLNSTDERAFERLHQRLPNLFPIEPPSLIHGDLWSGNFLCDKAGQPVLIDPAVCYAHREMDIAMTYLFGGFNARFYESYEATYPLAPGFPERLPIYQLYYLLAHVNLFGGSYVNSVRRVL